MMEKSLRTSLLNELVEAITQGEVDSNKIKSLAQLLEIEYSEDPMQLLNNVLKGIHFEGVKNEPIV